MAARIRSKRNGISPVDEASRNDLVVTDVVSLFSLDSATTYDWSIVFAPAGSTATFSGSSTAMSPGSFTVDLVGPYLIRLTVDASLPTEDTQYVRLRALTTVLGLRLVSAGERRDTTGTIPVDVSAEGWANDQNFNLQTLEAAIGAASSPLSAVLVVGNLTGGKNIILTSGDGIFGQSGAALGGDVLLQGGTPTSGVSAGGNITIRPGAGLGGPADGYLHLLNAAGTQGVRISVSSADTIKIDKNTGGGLPLLYNATTGKLTVPGLIDPTGTIYTEAGPPATTGTEGAVFVSDGTAGLIPGHLYFRGPSNGTPVDLTAGGSSQDLATTLGFGNTTGGTSIIVSSGDNIQGESDLDLVASGGNVNLDASASGSITGTTLNGTTLDNHLLRQGDDASETHGINVDPTKWGDTWGTVVRSPGQAYQPGDTESFDVFWFGVASDNTPTVLYLDGTSLEFSFPHYSVLKFTCEVIALTSGPDVAGFKISGVARRYTGAVQIVGTPLVETTQDGGHFSLHGSWDHCRLLWPHSGWHRCHQHAVECQDDCCGNHPQRVGKHEYRCKWH